MPDHYPSNWPTKGDKKTPPGLESATEAILAKARKRKTDIAHELRLADAGMLPEYPANRVREILRDWNVTV